jgi:hypothetical protein
VSYFIITPQDDLQRAQDGRSKQLMELFNDCHLVFGQFALSNKTAAFLAAD